MKTELPHTKKKKEVQKNRKTICEEDIRRSLGTEWRTLGRLKLWAQRGVEKIPTTCEKCQRK